MADFTALKTAIQNAIKQNGNEEITGNILQDILLSIITTLGDSAINDLISALGNEVNARQQADGTLQQNITDEATARGNADAALSNRLGSTITAENTAAAQIGAEAEARAAADTALQGLIDGITDNIENGYVYAGIATPSSTPTTGKVFYLALTAGTYTNFGNTAVTQGINILKYNDSAWSLDFFIGIDDTPTPNSQKLVKSGGTFESIMTDGSAFDISAHFASGGNLATYADLSAALAALNTLSVSYKKGGMSIKFVQSSDNKYVQYMCKSSTWSSTPTDWEIINNVSVSQNTNTGHTDITVGDVTTPVASVEDLSQLFPLTKVDETNLTLLGNAVMGNSTSGVASRMKIVSVTSNNIIYYYRVFKDVTYKLFSNLNWLSDYCAIGFSQALPVIGNSYDAQIVAADSPTSTDGVECTPQIDGYLLLQYHSSSKTQVYAPTPIDLQEELNSLKEKDVLHDEEIDEINDILTEKIVLQKNAETTGYLDRDGKICTSSATNFGLYYYQVRSGQKIHIQIGVLQDKDYKSAGFFAGTTIPVNSDTLSPIFGVSNASTDVIYDVPQDGWIVCRWRNAVFPVLTKIEVGNVGLKTINGQSVAGNGNIVIEVQPQKPLEGKTIAIFGDSIIQLFEEETSPSLSGTITLKNYSDTTDTNVYQIEDSTVIDGIIYLTSSLSGGQPISTSIRLEIVNSKQSTLDNMTWEGLRGRLSAADVIGLGFGGASIRQREIGITTQYPICGLLNEGAEDAFDNTVNLPNEVKMLKRLVDAGIRNTPDCCIIWMGVNSSHIREGKTLDWAMQLDYATLADDILGFDDRCEFFGGLRYAVETLYREFPYTNIVLVSPYQTSYADHTSDGTPDNYRGYSFLDNVSDAMRDLAKRYSCIFIDAFHEIGIANFAWKANSTDGKHAEAPTLGNLIPLFTRDGLHPSSEGKVVLLNYLVKRIETAYFDKK